MSRNWLNDPNNQLPSYYSYKMPPGWNFNSFNNVNTYINIRSNNNDFVTPFINHQQLMHSNIIDYENNKVTPRRSSTFIYSGNNPYLKTSSNDPNINYCPDRHRFRQQLKTLDILENPNNPPFTFSQFPTGLNTNNNTNQHKLIQSPHKICPPTNEYINAIRPPTHVNNNTIERLPVSNQHLYHVPNIQSYIPLPQTISPRIHENHIRASSIPILKNYVRIDASHSSPMQEHSIHEVGKTSIEDLSRFPPPNNNISQLMENSFGLPLLPPSPSNAFSSQSMQTSFHQDYNQFRQFSIIKQNSSNKFFSLNDASNYFCGVDNCDKLFVNNFIENIENEKLFNLQGCPSDDSSQIKELHKLQKSLTMLTSCSHFYDLFMVFDTNSNNIDKTKIINCDECRCASVNVEKTSTEESFNHKLIADKIKNQIKELKLVLTENVIQKATFKYKKALKKKERLKRQKQIKIFEKEIFGKRREEVEKKLDEWQKNMASNEKIIKEKLELQKAIEGTMSGVRLKISDLNKQLKLLMQLKKLRKVRAERRKKNEMTTEEFKVATKNFDSRTAALEKFIGDQMVTYKDEEHTLKVMLDIEAEVDAETRIRRRRKDAQLQASVYKKQLNEYLFGQKLDVKPDDPMYLFNQHYKMAEKNIANFLAIRCEWDNCIVVGENIKDATSVNLTFGLPAPPSCSQWAEYLINK